MQTHCDPQACQRCSNTPENPIRASFRYLSDRGGKIAERLSIASLTALSMIAGRSIKDLLEAAHVKT